MRHKKVKSQKKKDIKTIAGTFRTRAGQVKINDFRDLTIKIPANINTEVCEDRNGFLFDSNTGRVYALNKTGSFIFSKIKEGLHLSEIVRQLTNRYDVNEGIAVSDIQDFLYQLREFNIGSEE